MSENSNIRPSQVPREDQVFRSLVLTDSPEPEDIQFKNNRKQREPANLPIHEAATRQ